MISTALLRCFFTQVRLFVLILKYNFFTHGLQMPEEHLFFLKMNILAFHLNVQTCVEATDLKMHTIGPCTWVRVPVLNVQILDSWQFEVQV